MNDLWKELLIFLPAWEDALRIIIASAMFTALWRAFCTARKRPGKLSRRVVALVMMVITFLIAFLVFLARGGDPLLALADALVIGGISPGVWVALMAAAGRWAPWLAQALGEHRRYQQREGAAWTAEQRKLFEDTDRLHSDDLQRWREELEKVKRDG